MNDIYTHTTHTHTHKRALQSHSHIIQNAIPLIDNEPHVLDMKSQLYKCFSVSVCVREFVCVCVCVCVYVCMCVCMWCVNNVVCL